MKMSSQAIRSGAAPARCLAAMMLLAAFTGCGTGTGSGAANSAATAIAARALHGHVHGGQQPLAGAVIQLYAVGIGGLKSASTPLIASTVTTGADGSFNITGDWNCTSNTAAYGNNPLLYIVAAGGNPGLSSGTNNAAVVMVAALGPCSGIGASTDIALDELTTVAAVYALAPFMQDALDIGAQGANAVGLVNAFNTANLLVNVATGSAPGGSLPANATAPVTELNTLANIVAACVNSSGIGSPCSTLFSATSVGGSTPSDIVGVLLNIAANPAGQPGTLLNIVPTQPPFQPAFSSAPSDWTVALKFTGGGLNHPMGLALDASGDVWVANAGGNSVTELSSGGTLLTGTAGYSGSSPIVGAQGIAVDTNGNVWLADSLLSSVVELSVSAGSIQGSIAYTGGGIDGPTALAIDSHNNVWITNFAGASVTELNSQGAPVGSSPLTAVGQLQTPISVAIDSSGSAWVSDLGSGRVDVFGANQSLLSGSGYADGSMIAPRAIALDNTLSHVWIADNGIDATSLLGTSGSSLLAVPYTGGGLVKPAAVAVDGGGSVWVANSQTAGSVSKLVYSQSGVLSPAAGYGSLNTPTAIAVDASGCIWTANAGDNSVTELVGVATPAAMPLSASVGP